MYEQNLHCPQSFIKVNAPLDVNPSLCMHIGLPLYTAYPAHLIYSIHIFRLTLNLTRGVILYGIYDQLDARVN